MRTLFRVVEAVSGLAIFLATGTASADGGPGKQNLEVPLAAAKLPAIPQWTQADDLILSPIWLGDNDKGTLYAPLWRGAFEGIEDYVYTPADGDCTKTKGTVRIDWDSAANTVNVLIKGKNFQVAPSVTRTEGVNWFPDAFHPAPKDITNGAYRIWIVLASTTRSANFWYDPNTLNLLGSDFDFPSGPPAGAIPVAFPVFSITGSSQFSPDSQGNVVHGYTLAYDAVTVESGTFARAFATFCPQNLCEAAPLQPGISQLRPYVSPWQAPTNAPNWATMLTAGIGFDLHIETATDPSDAFGGNLPYVYSGITYVSNMTTLQGGVPNGWHAPLLPAIQNVSPVLEPVPNGNGTSCQPLVDEPHVTAPLYCLGQH